MQDSKLGPLQVRVHVVTKQLTSFCCLYGNPKKDGTRIFDMSIGFPLIAIFSLGDADV